MTVTLALEFAPGWSAPALHALRQPALDVLDLTLADAVATLTAADEGPVRAALDALAACSGVQVVFCGGEAGEVIR